MEWLGHLFEKYPEMAVYLAIGLGYLIGALKFRNAAGLGDQPAICLRIKSISVCSFAHRASFR
jgi:hypothetical protein